MTNAPMGFRAGAAKAGVKTGVADRLDVGLIVSDRPSTAAGVFTTNEVIAAPCVLTRKHLESGTLRAIVANSGIANACTGDEGDRNAHAMAKTAAAAVGCSPEEIAVASTGVIGWQLPMDRIGTAIAAVAPTVDGFDDFSRAIMTTDTKPKLVTSTATVGGTQVRILGVAKGAGMIHPNMATTLCFLTTDASVPPAVLRRALARSVADSFNAITVDGDTSTNDTVLLLANGRAGGPPITNGEALHRFTAALTLVAGELARMVVRDGEGATKLVEIAVEGAASELEARQAAMTVATSLLVKTALHGGEPNWGRILAALGRSGVEMREETTDVSFGELEIVRGGLGVSGVWDAAAAALEEKEIFIRIRLGVGHGAAKVWTSDLSEEYVRINGSYTS